MHIGGLGIHILPTLPSLETTEISMQCLGVHEENSRKKPHGGKF